MPIALTFTKEYEYDTLLAGITLPINLSSEDREVDFSAKVDTGSSHCIFQRMQGERLGFEIESGDFYEFSTATGMFPAFGHEVRLTVLDTVVYSKVYFAAEDYFSRNVLGRNGWLDRVQIGLIDYEGKFYINSYDSEAH